MINERTVTLSLIMFLMTSSLLAQLSLLNIGSGNVAALAQTNEEWNTSMIAGRIRATSHGLVDEEGRTIILRGVNVGQKGGTYLPKHDEASIKELVKETGINFVRFYIHWRKLEPKAHQFDSGYIREVARIAKSFTNAGVYVMIDLHQDVWGEPFSCSGAAAWTSMGLDRAQTPMTKGLPWQAQYLDRRVYQSFNHFWNDDSLPGDHMSLQQHYAKALGLVAKELADNDMVLGYDMINEPFMGEEIEFALDELIEDLASDFDNDVIRATIKSLAKGGNVTQEVGNQLIKHFQKAENFKKTFKPFARATAAFEKRLANFYKNVGTEIRRHDQSSILFLEPFALAGVGLPSFLQNPGFDNIVYTPHLYDCFMDSGLPYDNDDSRVLNALEAHVQTAKRLEAPLVIGEWGHLPKQADKLHVAKHFANTVCSAVNSVHCGSAYWDHDPGDEKKDHFRSAFHPYARRVAGTINKMEYVDGVFRLTYEPAQDVTAPTVVALPAICFGDNLAVDIQTDGSFRKEIQENPRLLFVWAEGKSVVVTVSSERKADEC